MSTPPLQLCAILHLHLPPGLPEQRADAAWERCVKPLIGAIHHTGGARVGLVLSGDLLAEIRQRHPEGLAWIQGLVDAEQVELVGTALHEPVLSAIPEADAVGQLKAHVVACRRATGHRPEGAWVPHGVWDPVLPRVLRAAGLSYTVLPGRLVHPAAEGPPRGVYNTEREGNRVAILVSEEELGNRAADVPVAHVLGALRALAGQGRQRVTLALEGDRLGLRAGSRAKRDQAWLATLLTALGNADDLQLVLPGVMARQCGGAALVYVPCAGPVGTPVPWEADLARYRGANLLHKRMQRTSRLVARLARRVREDAYSDDRPDPAKLGQARLYLHRGQAAGAYWHGGEGGVYDADLRHQAWRDLLRAERVALEEMALRGQPEVEVMDVDGDGNDEIVLRTAAAVAVVDPAETGGLVELAWYDVPRNVLDVPTRRAEPYHPEAGADAGAAESPRDETDDDATDPIGTDGHAAPTTEVILDDVARVGFRTRLLGPTATLESLRRCRAETEAADGVAEAWTVVSAERHGETAAVAHLQRDLRLPDERPAADDDAADRSGERKVRLSKRYTLYQDGVLDVRHILANRSHEAIHTRPALELALSLGGGAVGQCIVANGRQHAVVQPWDLGDLTEARFEGGEIDLSISLSMPARWWVWPVVSVHRAHGRLVRSTQGIALALVFSAQLWGQEKHVVDITVRMSDPGREPSP